MIPCKQCHSDNLLIMTHGLRNGDGYVECLDCWHCVVGERDEIERALKAWNTPTVIGVDTAIPQSGKTMLSYVVFAGQVPVKFSEAISAKKFHIILPKE